VGTRSLCAPSALVFFSLLAITSDDARAQQVSAALAAKVCQEKITAGVLNVKHIGPVEALHGASFRRSYGGNLNRGPDIVPESNVRLFRTRVRYSNILGMPLDNYAICFFEIRGNSYRFVQICGTKGLTSSLSNCNLRWIVTDSWYARVEKERKDSR
jgi:hypothetical protein